MQLINIVGRVINIFKFKTTLDSLGIKSAASSVMDAGITEWGNMYRNNGKRTLSLPSAIASEFARLCVLELKTKVTGSERADYINKQYSEVIKGIRQITEYAAALGGVIFKPYVSGDKIIVDCVSADRFIPLSFDATGRITAAAFLERVHRGDKIYTRIEKHKLSGNKYTVENFAFLSDVAGVLGRKITLSEVEEWRNFENRIIIENVPKPLFSYFKMPAANNVEPDSPLGVSVFSRACSLIEDANKQYERLLWEMESGERALYVDDAAIKKDKNGNPMLPDKRLYKLLSADDTLFKDWSPSLRVDENIKALNEILRKIEFTCSLAYGTLSDAQNNDKTAEEIRASKQRSYAAVSEMQRALQTALCNLAEAMDILCDLYELCPEGEYSVSFEFDDSIIADRKQEFAERTQLTSMGIIKPWEMRVWYLGEDEETAKANAEQSVEYEV